MKELSIEEKARAYDEAIKRASKLRVQNPFDTVSQMMEHVFPELKESEDERIRKEIISFIQDDIDEINLKVSGDYDDRDEDDIAHQNWCKGAIAWLEKQGEQKVSVVEFNAKDWYVSKVDGKIHNLYHSVDKVKPKFEIGNWVISTLPGIKYPHLITDIKDGYYIFGEDDDHAHIASNDDILKLWTIEDARDGDVLATKDNCICIFDNTVEEGKYPFAYCGLSMYGFKVCDRTLPFTHDNVYPATKEQRDILFQKIHEEGYEWDSKNKELKKIHIIDEDKAEIDYCFTKMMNGEKVSPKDEEYNGEDYGIDGLWHAMNILERTLGKVDGYQTDDGFLSHQCAITAIKKLYEQKSAAWSKEDERMFDYALDMIEWYSGKNGDKSKLVSDWLKSIKDRVQPKQEWSKEDKERFISCLKRLGSGNPEQPETINSKWFKEHVFPQKQWKPSNEQIVVLELASKYERVFTPKQIDILIGLKEQLKKLKG